METLESVVGYLRAIQNGLRDEGRALIAASRGTLRPCDAVAVMSVNRAILLIDGSLPLLDQKNMVAGAALVRMQLDTYLRFDAVASFSDPHHLANRVLNGEELRKIKGDDNEKMTDAHLVRRTADTDAKVIYAWANGHVHLSERHFRHLMAASPLQNNGQYLFRVGAEFEYMTPELMFEWAHALRQTSGAVAFVVKKWRERRGEFEPQG